MNVRVISIGGMHRGRDALQETAHNTGSEQWVPREENVRRRATPLPTFDM